MHDIEAVLYKNVDYIMNKDDTKDFFTKIQRSFEEEDGVIYSCGFSFGEADIKYVEEIKNVIGKRVKWYLSKHDFETDKEKGKTETYKARLEKIGFDVDYTNY